MVNNLECLIVMIIVVMFVTILLRYVAIYVNTKRLLQYPNYVEFLALMKAYADNPILQSKIIERYRDVVEEIRFVYPKEYQYWIDLYIQYKQRR